MMLELRREGKEVFGMSEARKDEQEEVIKEGQVFYLGGWIQGELNNIRQEIREIRSEIRSRDENFQQRLDSHRLEIKQDMNNLRQEIKQDINNLRQEMREDIAGIRRDINKLQYWAFGTFITIIIAIVLNFYRH